MSEVRGRVDEEIAGLKERQHDFARRSELDTIYSVIYEQVEPAG